MRTQLVGLAAVAWLGALVAATYLPASDALTKSCAYWVAPAPAGDDANPGSFDAPWATLDHASAQTLALGGVSCTVWFSDGLYSGHNDLHERFATPTTFRALNPYKAILEHDGVVVELSGASNIALEGFEIRHGQEVPRRGVPMVYVSRAGDQWAEQVVFRNTIFRDSYSDDLLKIHNGVRFLTVEGSIFYNQGPREEHIDINGVTDILIQDNIFFNDFAGSGRDDGEDVHSFITIKDSTGNPDGAPGSRQIAVRRNIFLGWQGRRDTFIQVGNDGKPYHEAAGVRIENNLMVGNGPDQVYALLGVRGARDVTFANNTVVGDLPSSAYAFWIARKGDNPHNQNIAFFNNIWSDPTGTMGSGGSKLRNRFSTGNPDHTDGLTLDNNLYWNGPAEIPPGTLVSPLDADGRRVVADPLLSQDHAAIVLPRWDGAAFASGSATARQEFERLAELYGALPAESPAVGVADPAHAPPDDLLGRPRDASPDLGAYERQPPPPPEPTPTAEGLPPVEGPTPAPTAQPPAG